jgi:RNA polymerase sigma factor (sigma-70 family)
VKREEIEETFADLAPRLALYAMAHLRLRHEDAVDAVQQAFVRFLESPHARQAAQTRVDLVHYLFGAVKSYASHLRERTSRRERIEFVLWSSLVPESPADPESQLLTKEQRERLRNAIRRLNEPYRSIFTLHVERELALVEIARELGVSRKGIYIQFQRGRRELRRILSDV